MSDKKPAKIFTAEGVITKIVDGDTIKVILDLGWHAQIKETVRLINIDAPEMGTDGGRAAKAFLEELLPIGTTVTIVSSIYDKYKRTIGEVILPTGSDLSTVMVNEGHAVWRKY